jgi:hypothetical protein
MPIYDRLPYFSHYLSEGFWDGVPLQIVCDGSPEATTRALETLVAGRPMLRLHHYAPNRGVAFARGHGVALAGTPYMAFCDDDDFLADPALFFEEATAQMDNDASTLFVAMPDVVAFDESLQMGRQYDRRGFDGKTGIEILCYLVATGEMQVLTLGSLFRPSQLRGAEPEPFFKVSEDYTWLVRLCARFPTHRVRVSSGGRYMRLVHRQGSLSARAAYGIDRMVMHLVSMGVGASYLIGMGRLTLPQFQDILRRRGDVLLAAYGRGRQAACTVANCLGRAPVAVDDPESAEALQILQTNRDGLPREFIQLAGWL